MLRTALLFSALAVPALAVPTMAATPQPPIADLWYAHNAVTVMLGAGDRIAVTVCGPKQFPWLYKVAPALAQAEVVPNGAANAEELLSKGVGLAFTSSSVPAGPLKAVGIEAHQLSFDSEATMLKALKETAKALHSNAATAEVADYKGYLQKVTARIAAKIANIPQDARPRVLHIKSVSPLEVDGQGTIIDEWIRRAGGRNAVTGLSGNMKKVSLEQVMAWQPDVIILGGSAGDLPKSGAWSSLKAVQDGRVYRNPTGVFPWDRYSAEFALQLQWTAQKLYPKLFAQRDMTQATKDFYKRFYHYDLTQAQAQRILDNKPPA